MRLLPDAALRLLVIGLPRLHRDSIHHLNIDHTTLFRNAQWTVCEMASNKENYSVDGF